MRTVCKGVLLAALPLTWKRLSALTAALSSLMYCPSSRGDRLKELKLDSSDSSSRKRTTAARQDMATWMETREGERKREKEVWGAIKGYKEWGERDFFFSGNEMKIYSDVILKCRSYRRNNITKEILFV